MPLHVLTIALLAVVALHALAWSAAPGSLWGLSHLAAWDLPWALGTTAAVVGLVLAVSRNGRTSFLPEFPRRRGALVVALVSGAVFWLLRERTHFFGDGYLLVRDRGFSETVTRAPLLVRATASAVQIAERHFGFAAETTLALLSVVSGVVAVFALLRWSAYIGRDRAERWLLAVLLGTAGSVQLFFGHVEYYAAVAAAVLVYLSLAARVLVGAEPPARSVTGNSSRGRHPRPASRGLGWTTVGLWSFGALLPLHLSTLGLAPAHAYLMSRVWSAGRRLHVVLAVPGILVVAWGLTRAGGGGARELAGTSIAGWSRYTAPFLDSTTARHAFDFLSPGHLLAVANDVLLAAPLVLLVFPAGWYTRRHASDSSTPDTSVLRFLAIASAGCLLVSLLFARELGPYRDWDILAPYGFVLLGFTGAVLLRARLQRAWMLVLVCGLFHTLPWIVTNATPRAALAHVHLALGAESQWSPHARAYMHESLAIYAREQGDEQTALREYEAAVRANPADSRYRVGLGNRYVQRGELRPAAREYAAALERRPDYAPAHNNLAFVLASLGEELERARHHVNQAIQLDPDNADYWLTRARVEAADGRTLAAREALQRALALRRPFPAAEELLHSLEK